MTHLRLLCLATAGIGGYLHSSWTNVFKVNAQPEYTFFKGEESTCSKHTFNLSNISFPDEVESLFDLPRQPLTSTPTRNPTWCCPLKPEERPLEFSSPNLSCLDDRAFYVCNNPDTGILNWSLEHIAKKQLSDDKTCVHDDSNFLVGGIADDPPFHVANNPRFGCYRSFNLYPCIFQAVPPREYLPINPNYRIWSDFYEYVVHLNEKHKNLYICSGPVYKKRQSTSLEYASHFYKVILAEYRDGCYRIECFKFDNRRLKDGYVQIGYFRVSKTELEGDIGYKLFSEIPPNQISEPCFGIWMTCAVS